METMVLFIAGGTLVILAIAHEAGRLRLHPIRRHRELHSHPGVSEDQCLATTANGSRCVRVKTDRQSRYCWQHQRMAQAGRRSATPAPVQPASAVRRDASSRIPHRLSLEERQRQSDEREDDVTQLTPR
jgi:hypothetical protein